MNRIEYALKQFGEKLVQANALDVTRLNGHVAIVNAIAAIDPTKNKRYLVWLCNAYAHGQFRLEDKPRISACLTNFVKYINRLTKRDIASYASISDVEDAVEEFAGKPVSIRQETRAIKDAGVEKMVDTDSIKIYKLLTADAAKFYGSGTKWCTAADEHNAFDSYKNGLFVIMIGDRKWQLHIESDQFMDEKDRAVSDSDLKTISDFDEYTNFINAELLKIYTIVEE